MKTAGDIIIDLVERFGVHDPGAKRAHDQGTYHTGRVELNAAGKAVFGDVEHVLIRLSNASSSQRVPDWLVNIKGCSIRFQHPLRPVDIIAVNFPYFPFDSPEAAVALFYRIHFFMKDRTIRRFINIFRTGKLYRHFGRLGRWMPKKTEMNHMYYSTHSYGEECLKFRVHYEPDRARISLYSEQDQNHTDYKPQTRTYLGHITLDPKPRSREVKYMDTMNAPLGHHPNGNMPLLRHYMYTRSFLGRMEEARLTKKEVGMLEQVWAEEKYFVLSKSQRIYDEIRELLKAREAMSVPRFRQLIDEAYETKYDEKHIRNYCQHVWGHFKHKADVPEKERYRELLTTLDPDSINAFISDMALKYEDAYLLNSTIVKTRGKT